MSRILQYTVTVPGQIIGGALYFHLEWLLGENMSVVIASILRIAGLWVFMSGTIYLLWLIYCDLYPPRRFSKLTRYVDNILPKEDEKININKRGTKAFYRAELCGKLERFGIKTPDIYDHRIWANWFPLIMGLAGNCDLKEARKLDPEKLMEGKPQPSA